MEEFIEGLKKIQLSKRTQERIKLFKENVHQIYHLLEQPRPYLVKQIIIGGDSTKYIKQENQQLEVANKGVIVGRIYKVLNPQKSLDDDKNLSFKGSCFLATNYLAVCCSHQVIEDNKYIVRIDNRFISTSKTIQLNVKKIYHNSFEKKQPGEQKSQDYAFLIIEMEQWLKNSIHDNLARTTLTTIGEIEHSMFNFDATIYAYFEKIPKQFQGDQQWLGWTQSNLIKSSGVADYSKKELSYTVSTDFGFSGAPIVLQHEGKCHIVGIHTRGSHFHSKNFGILFNKPFFHYLQEVINELFNKEKGYDILQQKLSIVSLASIVKYKRTFKDKLLTQPLLSLSFIEKALEKIIQKIASLEESELVLEQLRLQDIIISKEYQEDFVIDFSRLRLCQYVEKGSQVLNLKCISMLLLEIQTVRKKPLLPKLEQMKLNEDGSVEDKGQQGVQKMVIMEGCLLESYQYPSNIYCKKTKFMLDLINFVKQNYATIQQYYMYREAETKCKEIDSNQREKELNNICEMTGFNLNQHMFRKKFMNLMKYSQEKLSDRVIARVYLIKLCSFYNQLQKVIKFFGEFAKNLDNQILHANNITTNGIVSRFQTTLKRLLEVSIYQKFPKFSFLNKNLNFQEEDGGIKVKCQIRNAYRQILKCQQIYFQQNEIEDLVHYQYLFCRVFSGHFQQFTRTVKLQCIQKNLMLRIHEFDQTVWQKKMSDLLKQQPHLLKKNELRQKPFNIYEAKIFQELFIDYEHSVFNKALYNIIDMTQAEEAQYEEIINILVQIRDKDGLSKGTGFFLNKDTVCTTRHIFEGQNFSRYKIVNQRARLQANVIREETSLSKHSLCSDIIFLKVQVRFYSMLDQENLPRKRHFSQNIHMLENDIALDSKQFEEKNYFGLLIGFRKIEGSNQIRPTKSYGQIQMHSKFHPLIGEHHLSGSPILLRIAKQPKNKKNAEYQYVIIGIYSGVQLETKGFSSMQRFIAKCFDVQKSFLNTIEFRRLSQCINQFQDQYKQIIEKIFLSLDHFLLRVMGQIMRLNSLNIYLKDLTIHHILFGSNRPTDIQFSSLPIYLHLQYLHPDHRINGIYEKIKLQLENENKNIFSKFIKSLLGHIFDGNEIYVKQSVMINQLLMLEKSSSLVQYFTVFLEGKYYFDQESCTLKPYSNFSQQIIPLRPIFLPQESKFDLIFNSWPAEHLARITLGYNLLKNTECKIEDIMLDNRDYLLSEKYSYDLQILMNCTKDKINDQEFYYLAKKILHSAIKEAQRQLKSEPSLDINEINENQEFTRFKEKYMSYIKNLTSFSNLNIIKRNDFKIWEQKHLQRYYKPSKNWSFVSDILDLYNLFQA